MRFNIANRLSNLFATTASILNDLSQKQTIIVAIANTLPTKQALRIQSETETGSPDIDTDNNIRHVFSGAPLQASLYFNPLEPSDRRSNHIHVSFDTRLTDLVNYFTKTDSDTIYYTHTGSNEKYAPIVNVHKN